MNTATFPSTQTSRCVPQRSFSARLFSTLSFLISPSACSSGTSWRPYANPQVQRCASLASPPWNLFATVCPNGRNIVSISMRSHILPRSSLISCRCSRRYQARAPLRARHLRLLPQWCDRHCPEGPQLTGLPASSQPVHTVAVQTLLRTLLPQQVEPAQPLLPWPLLLRQYRQRPRQARASD